MARNRVGIKGSNQTRVQRKVHVSDVSNDDEDDEEYKVTDEENEDGSDDDFYDLDVDDESEEILADFGIGKSRRVSRSRNGGATRYGKKVNETRKRKRVCYKEEDDAEDEDEDEDFMSLDRKAKPMGNKSVLYTEVDDSGSGGGGSDDGLIFGRNRKQIKKPREKKSVVYTDDEDDVDEDVSGLISLDTGDNHLNEHLEKKRVAYEQVNDDDGVDSDNNDDDDDDDDNDEDFKEEDDEDDGGEEFKEDDEEELNVAGEDDAECMSLGTKPNQIRKSTEMEMVSHTEISDDDIHDDDYDDGGDEDSDYTESVSAGRKRNQRKKPHGKEVESTEDEDEDMEEYEVEEEEDDDEFNYSGRKVKQPQNIREKRGVTYTEKEKDDDVDDNDSGFMSKSKKRNKRHKKRAVLYEEDNQEEEDENDAEFKLSESDFFDDEDEDETPKIKKKSVGGQKKSKQLKIKTKKRKDRNHRFGQKLVTNKTQMENRNKRRKQRAMVESDSDFVSPASSDHEYTISEEEREQMREAKVYCANLRANLRSSSCGNQEKQPATYEQSKYSIRKGKAKTEGGMKDDLGKQVCGICLSEEQKRTMRGVLNCCRHYFCFSCIMVWSKVESRCPLCKQRFTTITKAAAKSDTRFESRTVVIPVPVCDQVYEPSEEELRGYLDPYESVICTECHNGGDDALMLLCDICDSSAHTFCVGLGRQVPEGNWYCEGCTPTNLQTPTADRRLGNNASDLSTSPIAGGFDLNELYVPETPSTQQIRVHPEPSPAPTVTAATTLRDRRRVFRQVHRNNNRMNDLVGRSSETPASSSSPGIRLFGSQLDQARFPVSENEQFFSSTHDFSNFYPRTDQFSVQVQNSNLASADVALQDEHVPLQELNIGIRRDPPVH